MLLVRDLDYLKKMSRNFLLQENPQSKKQTKMRKKKVAELIRLMKHAKDAHTDVARKPVAK